MIKALCVALALSVLPTASLAADAAREPLTLVTGEAEHTVQVEIADTPRARGVGLMFRDEMAPDHGMLFVYDGEAERTMWMRNTILPLDMLFIAADGRIVSIARDAVPFSEEIISSGAPARAVLELNAGRVDALGVAVGDRVVSQRLAE